MNNFDLPDTCLKCGFTGRDSVFRGEALHVWSGPRFRGLTLSGEGYLEFTCQRCGFEIQRPTLDAGKPVFPPNRVIREGQEG